jgi:hypothetical protein
LLAVTSAHFSAAEGPGGAAAKSGGVMSYEVSRTLLKSPPELWAELEGDRLREALGQPVVRTTEPERELSWKGGGAAGRARLEPSSWGTKVTLTAWVEEQVAEGGLWGRLRRRTPASPRHDDLEQRLEGLLDDLGSDHKKPFVRTD